MAEESEATHPVLLMPEIMTFHVFPRLSRRDKGVVSLVCREWRDMWNWKWWIPERAAAWANRFRNWICWDIIENNSAYLYEWLAEYDADFFLDDEDYD